MIVSIPLLSVAQRLVVVLRGVTYQLTVSRNTRMGYWTVTIEQGEQTLVAGAALVGGVDIVEQFTFELKDLWVPNITDSTQDAGPDNLGTDVLLVQVDNEDIEAFATGDVDVGRSILT